MARAWLIVERLQNWKVDEENGFSFFGLSDRYRKISSEIAANDLIICYVSGGPRAFSDIRMVKESGLRELEKQSYKSNFAYCFSTMPILVLPRKKWVPLEEVASELDLARGRNYQVSFQTSI